MAWNPSPEVAVARDAARKLKADRVVVVFIRPNGVFGFASYGETKKLCAEAKELGEDLFSVTRAFYLGPSEALNAAADEFLRAMGEPIEDDESTGG